MNSYASSVENRNSTGIIRRNEAPGIFKIVMFLQVNYRHNRGNKMTELKHIKDMGAADPELNTSPIAEENNDESEI